MRPLNHQLSELWELPTDELQQVIEAAGDDARAGALNILITGSRSPEAVLGAYVTACWDGRRSAAARRKRGRATPGTIADIPDDATNRLEYLRRSIDAIPLGGLVQLFQFASAHASSHARGSSSTTMLEGQDFQESEREYLLKLISNDATEIERLRALMRIQETVERLTTEFTRDARQAGASWNNIGVALGVSGDTARKRYRRSVSEPSTC